MQSLVHTLQKKSVYSENTVLNCFQIANEVLRLLRQAAVVWIPDLTPGW